MEKRLSVPQGTKNLEIEQTPASDVSLPKTGNIFVEPVRQMADILADLRAQYPAHEVTV